MREEKIDMKGKVFSWSVYGVFAFPGISLLLIGLKLVGLIGWSWYEVTAPVWAPVSLAIGGLIVLLLAAGIISIIRRVNHRRRIYARR